MTQDIVVSNKEFLQACFGEDYIWSHVTDFPYDPNNIPKDQHLNSWSGNYFNYYRFKENSNQYFTISTFYCDDQQRARRRKALFRQTHVIVLDDVKEKLDMSEVSKLPRPSWILETSVGSEQYGYILDTPCTDRYRSENLLDGLVANGLAPDGNDPGMKGVTRYVRLPEGINNKASKLVNGQPFKCRMLLWEPANKVTMEQLAAPFNVDLNADRREQRVDGAANVPDHPLINIPDVINIKEVRSDGRFDITCPWVHEHTGQDDSGTAIFTNEDGSMGFKCHHGHCQGKTGKDLMQYIEGQSFGFGATYNQWLSERQFADIKAKVERPALSFMGEPEAVVEGLSFIEPVQEVQPVVEEKPEVGIDRFFSEIRRTHPTSAEAKAFAVEALKLIDKLPHIDRVARHDELRDIMQWSKVVLKDILKDCREQWYQSETKQHQFYGNLMYVKELNQFYDWRTRIFFSPEAFQNSFIHEDEEARKNALQNGMVQKVDRLNYAPSKERVYTEQGMTIGNTYVTDGVTGVQGDAATWLNHFDVLGWGDHRDHVLKWMAYTIKHPEHKINHMLIFGSGEGCGKDFLLYPLIEAMGRNNTVISGEELTGDFQDYLLATKYLHINEVELGNRKEATKVSAKIKPLSAAPPLTHRVNQKGIKPITIDNIVNCTMTCNTRLPLNLQGTSRRIYAMWSDFNPRDHYGEMRPEWMDYWDKNWNWMRNGGSRACIWYLENCVDLSEFNPMAPPPMTEFLREIVQQSKTPAEQTLEAFIVNKAGAFQSDLISASEAALVLKAGEQFAPHLVYCDVNQFTPTRVNELLRSYGGKQYRLRSTDVDKRVWCIRDFGKYEDMSNTGRVEAYLQQTEKLRSSKNLRAVN